MAAFIYLNDYDANKSNASDYVINGQRIIEVWQNGKCLGVELDDAQEGFERIPKVIFFIDRTQIQGLFRDTIPSNEELVEILEQHV